ncbi:MAG: major facilitator superfamily protein [Candidatus Aramenus sulfurataquae]|jgi:MFS family permease|uniref:MFS transporter n=3 Tax=Candidatus Aramenus sulfurataquae TaxID=1326980 RepID=W7KPA0_9CREN|nr:MAG: major facilitator superfamily protein [Candidatus Aramenus sulfurataquae]MCL7344540.1 MFS transporter [Candidatus Aramenus sulfurataquae]
MGYFDTIPTKDKARAFLVSSSGFLLDGYDLSVISFAEPFIQKEMSLSSAQLGLVVSSSLIGMIIGSLLLGRLSDRVGRKKLMGIDLFFFLVFALTSALSQNFYELFSSRLLLGVGIGGDYPISSTLLSEVSPSRSRGQYLVGAVAMYWVGALLANVANLLFLPAGPYFWRYVFLLGSIISVPIVIARIKLLESPRWLVYAGKVKAEVPKELESKGAHGFLDIFKGTLLIVTVVTSAVWFLFDVAAYGIGLYYPYILKEFAFPSYYSVIYGTILISLASLAGYLVAVAVIDRWLGRRGVLLVGLGSMAFMLYLGAFTKIVGPVLVPYFMTFVALEQWAGAVTLFYPTELFPTSVRSTGQGFATAVSRVGAVLGVYYFPQMTKELGFSTSLEVFATTSLVAFLVSLWFVKETRKMQLEETSVGVREPLRKAT